MKFITFSSHAKVAKKVLMNQTTSPHQNLIDYFKYNKNNFLIMVDSYSKWLDVEIVSYCDTKNTTLCLSKWFSHYGIPAQLISDNGTQFIS